MEKNVQQPVAWLSIDCIGERYLCFSEPSDNDEKLALYTAPPVPRDVLMAFGEAVRDAIHEYNGVDISTVDITAIADRYASKVQPEPVNQQLLTVARSILVPDMIDLLPPEYVAKVQSAIAAAEAAQPVYVQQWGRANRVKVTPTQQPASAQPLSDAELGDLIISIADSNGFDTKDPAGVDELCRAVARAIEARPASSHPVAVPDEKKQMMELANNIASSANPEEDERLDVAYAIARYLKLDWPAAYENQDRIRDGWRLEKVPSKEFDELFFWIGRCSDKGHLENCPDLVDPVESYYRAMLSEDGKGNT